MVPGDADERMTVKVSPPREHGYVGLPNWVALCCLIVGGGVSWGLAIGLIYLALCRG